jgi:hypothetical protein
LETFSAGGVIENFSVADWAIEHRAVEKAVSSSTKVSLFLNKIFKKIADRLLKKQKKPH